MLNFKTHGKQNCHICIPLRTLLTSEQNVSTRSSRKYLKHRHKIKKNPTKTSTNKLENRMGKIKVFFIQLAKAFKMNWFCFMIGLNNN